MFPVQSASERHGVSPPSTSRDEKVAMEVDKEEDEEEEVEGAKAMATAPRKGQEKEEEEEATKKHPHHQPPRPIQNKTLSKLMGMLESAECSLMALSTASNSSSRIMESVASQDTGFGSMPSSMVLSMGTSMEIGVSKRRGGQKKMSPTMWEKECCKKKVLAPRTPRRRRLRPS